MQPPGRQEDDYFIERKYKEYFHPPRHEKYFDWKTKNRFAANKRELA
jgi:hypothetical protein